jgi:hypothetical protein
LFVPKHSLVCHTCRLFERGKSLLKSGSFRQFSRPHGRNGGRQILIQNPVNGDPAIAPSFGRHPVQFNFTR